jgi:hypothetical protein
MLPSLSGFLALFPLISIPPIDIRIRLCNTTSNNAVIPLYPSLFYRKEEVMCHMDSKNYERSAVASLLDL